MPKHVPPPVVRHVREALVRPGLNRIVVKGGRPVPFAALSGEYEMKVAVLVSDPYDVTEPDPVLNVYVVSRNEAVTGTAKPLGPVTMRGGRVVYYAFWEYATCPPRTRQTSKSAAGESPPPKPGSSSVS